MISNPWKHAFYLTIIIVEKKLPHITSCDPLRTSGRFMVGMRVGSRVPNSSLAACIFVFQRRKHRAIIDSNQFCDNKSHLHFDAIRQSRKYFQDEEVVHKSTISLRLFVTKPSGN